MAQIPTPTPQATVTWSLDYSYIQVAGGKPITVTIPTLSEKNVALAAGDMISVVIPKDTDSLRVDLQPTTDAGTIRSILMINSPNVSKDTTAGATANTGTSGGTSPTTTQPASEYLYYTVNGGSDQIPLGAYQVLIGYGVFKLLNDVPTYLNFSNKTGNDASVCIVVGRGIPPEDEGKTDTSGSGGSGGSGKTGSKAGDSSSSHGSTAQINRPGAGVHDQGAGSGGGH